MGHNQSRCFLPLDLVPFFHHDAKYLVHMLVVYFPFKHTVHQMGLVLLPSKVILRVDCSLIVRIVSTPFHHFVDESF